ncbi:MAG: ABC transporter permease, partial [Deferribacteres bacterium]|nr:ABC transporter permease [Deferribacteres bacterium]
MLRKPLAFVKKDFLAESSYKLSFIFRIFSVMTSLLSYYFIDKMFGHRVVGYLEEFGVNYFSYVLLSTAFFSYVGVGLGSFSGRIRSEQVQGTLEALLLTPTKVPTILFSMSLWNLLFATLNMLIYLIAGRYLFRISFDNVNILSAFVILILTILSFSSLGILSASFIMVFKRGNPVGWLISSLEGLIGGVYFPVAVLPVWVQFLAKFLPITYAIRAIELAVYRNYSLAQLSEET